MKEDPRGVERTPQAEGPQDGCSRELDQVMQRELVLLRMPLNDLI